MRQEELTSNIPKHQSENVSVNIILPVGLVSIISHNEQFVSCYRIGIP